MSYIFKQYKEMKKKHPDAVLLFRIGDFYECFNEDAKAAAEILDITLTYRMVAKKKIYLTGFPHHCLDTYLPKLVRAGKRVAICEKAEVANVRSDIYLDNKPSVLFFTAFTRLCRCMYEVGTLFDDIDNAIWYIKGVRRTANFLNVSPTLLFKHFNEQLAQPSLFE